MLLSVPAARPLIDADVQDDGQVVFILPDRHDVPAITALLERLDERREALGIASYAVSDTALEEVVKSLNTVSRSTLDFFVPLMFRKLVVCFSDFPEGG